MRTFAGVLAGVDPLDSLAPVLQAGYRESTAEALHGALFRKLGTAPPILFEEGGFHDRLSRPSPPWPGSWSPGLSPSCG